MKNYRLNQAIIIALTLTALLSACQGAYLNGLMVVENISPEEQAQIQPRPANQRQPQWDECDVWQRVTLHSDLDVDTAYDQILRSGVLDVTSIPRTNNEQLNTNILKYWTVPDERPHLLYSMPPRTMVVTVGDFTQTGAVALWVRKFNRGGHQGSIIDAEYCKGGKYDLGFYIPDQLEKDFEKNLIHQLGMALHHG